MPLSKITFLINTHSSCSDIWDLISKTTLKYLKDYQVLILSDKKSDYFGDKEIAIYNPIDDFTTQYEYGLKKIKTKYLITLNDDYILTNKPKVNEIKRLINFLEKNNTFKFVRLFKGTLKSYMNIEITKNLYLIDNKVRHLYSQTATLWETKSLLNLYKISPRGFIGKRNNLTFAQSKFNICTEDAIDEIAIKNKLWGLYYFNGEKKIGHSFHECSILPHLNSIIIGGKLNFIEYEYEIKKIFETLNIKTYRKFIKHDFKTKIHSLIKKILSISS